MTGTSTAATTASKIRATKSSSFNNAEPANLLHTFFAGQPILMSTIWAPFDTWYLAACASSSGSEPAICAEIGASSPSKFARYKLFLLIRKV